MAITSDIEDKLDSATTLLEKVKVLLNEAHEPEVMYNKLPDQEETIEDIALIQCFYGTDIARIRATTQAMEFNLQMTAKPSTWVFVECQKKKSEAAFQWLKRYGVKYVFVQMKPENEGIMLKNPLWNIGVENCTESKLCFVDSDVVMCNSDWIKKAASEFDSYDVLSLASHQYCQASDDCKLYETIGYKWVSTGKVDKGHVGFTLGLTRKMFNLIGGLDPAIILDDIHTYHKIMGDEAFKSFEKWYKPFDLPSDRKLGYNVELGYADNIACHVWHGDAPSKYDDLTKLMVASGVKSMSDMFDYSRDDELPAWKTHTAKGMALSKAILKYYEHVKKNELVVDKQPDFDIVGEYRYEMKRLLGEPDEKHPLFICTVVKDRFGLKLEDFTKFRNMVEDKFMGAKVQPVVLFFTDCKKYDFKDEGFNVVPIKNYNPEDEFSQCLRKDLKYPKGVVVYYIPFDLNDFNSEVFIPDGRVDFPNGSVVISKVK